MPQKDGTRMRMKYMKKENRNRNTKVIIAIIIVLLLLLLVKLISMYMKKIEHEKYMMSRYNAMYTRVLYIEGEFEYERDKVIIKTMDVDRRELIMDVVLYNEYNEDKLTVDGLIEDYYEFCETGKEQDGMRKFFDFDRADGHVGVEHPLSRYLIYISEYLEEKYGMKYFDDATDTQLEEAAQYAAERWHEDENEIYENRK